MNNLALQIAPQRELHLDAFIPSRISDLSASVGKSIAAMLASRFGISISEWRVMVVVGRAADLSAVEVAQRTQLDKVAVSRAVTKLLKNGRLDRKFADADRRRSILNLTEEGRQLFDEIAPIALNFEDSLLGDLTGAEIATFNKVIEKLQARSRLLARLAPSQ